MTPTLRPRPRMTKPTLDHGTWHIDPITFELVLKRQYWIRIDLEQCNTSSQLLDWIFHYRAKLLSNQELADMLHALENIIDPRANLCSFGANMETDSSVLVKDYIKRVLKS